MPSEGYVVTVSENKIDSQDNANPAQAGGKELTERSWGEDVKQYLRRGVSAVEWRTRFLSGWARRVTGLMEPRKFHPEQVSQGITFVLPGIEAESVFTYGICDGLVAGGMPGAVKVFNWGLPFPGGYLANLTRLDRNRRRAKDIAAEICRYQDQYPHRPVHVVAHSGGCGVAVFALEALPEGREVDSLVLLAGAISPTYDLRGALRKSRQGILNAYSHKDWLVLGLGTRLFGTTDRQFCEGCGKVGFVRPADLNGDGYLYDKLEQLAWQPHMMSQCRHWGGHISSAAEEYLARYIAPWMMRGI